MAHPPRSNPPLRSSSGPPRPCITPSTETFVVVVSFMVFLSLVVLLSDLTGRTHRSHRSWRGPCGGSCRASSSGILGSFLSHVLHIGSGLSVPQVPGGPRFGQFERRARPFRSSISALPS